MDAAKFWIKVRRGQPDECWPWTGKHCGGGYGQVYVSDRRRTGAHRAAYAFTCGAIPEGLQVLHRCDNPPCCNPAHLFLGTNADNMADKARKGRCNPNGSINLLRGISEKNAHTSFQPGERHWAAKMTRVRVLEARERYADGGITEKQLATEYGISKSAMHDLLRGINWKSA